MSQTDTAAEQDIGEYLESGKPRKWYKRRWIWLLAALVLTSPAQAQMYRYTDEHGQIVIGNTIPQEATRRGYDILSNSGRVIETIPPAPTPEEIAAREAEKQRQREAERQRQADELLLKRFTTPDQAVQAMHRKIRELEGLSETLRDRTGQAPPKK